MYETNCKYKIMLPAFYSQLKSFLNLHVLNFYENGDFLVYSSANSSRQGKLVNITNFTTLISTINFGIACVWFPQS